MEATHLIQPYDVSSSHELPHASARNLVNVHSKERLASALVGGLALAYARGLRRGRASAIAALGSALVYRGVTGHCHLYQTLGLSTSEKRDERIASGARESAR
jgi:uncharacterized membrane protein